MSLELGGSLQVSEDLYGRIYRSFAAHADRSFIVEDGRRWTYGEVERATGRLAAHLQALGLKPGDRLLAQMEKSAEALILYFACIHAGGVYLPLNVDYTAAELAYFVADAEPVIAVCRPQSTALFERLGA